MAEQRDVQALADLRDFCERVEQTQEGIAYLRRHWERIADGDGDDTEDTIDNRLYWLGDDLTTTEALAALDGLVALLSKQEETAQAMDEAVREALDVLSQWTRPIERSEIITTAVDILKCRAVSPACCFRGERVSGVERIAVERQRQIASEGWTPEHDDLHTLDEMSRAAACYAIPPRNRPFTLWPWDSKWWKPSPDDRIRELVKAGALIAAEIDRLERRSVSPVASGTEGEDG